jgi:hypothetical protein
MTVSEITYETTPAMDRPSAPAAIPAVNRIWPIAVIAFGLGLTAVWICLLGYGILKLVELVV